MAIDPVCGMTVDEKSAAGSAVHAGKSYHFCSQHCLEKFQANPTEYIVPVAAPVAQSAGGYTCPCLLYTSPSPRDGLLSRMPSSA